MSPQHVPPATRRRSRVVLWLVVLGVALGVFAVGMLGTGIALASGNHGVAHPDHGVAHSSIDTTPHTA